MPEKPLSWKTVRDQRRKQNFVGRENEQRLFSDNLAGNERPHMLFAVTGEGGVGKSTLLQLYKGIATSPSVGGIVIRCDEHQAHPIAAMTHIAKKLVEYGVKHKDFEDLVEKYQNLQHEIGQDAKAPRAGVRFMSMGLTHLAIKTAKAVPGVGAIFEDIDTKEAGEALTQLVEYAIDRGRNKDEIELLQEPEQKITPHFLELVAKACEQHKVVLMFDVFERTWNTLSTWLLALLNFEYGEFSTNLTFVISGRDRLEQHWTELGDLIRYVPLEPFTLEETRIYLGNRGIVDERLGTQIYEDTGGLPVIGRIASSRQSKAW